MAGFLPVYFEAPLVNPSPTGLYAATQWTDEAGPPRWLDSGVEIRRHNYGGEDATGVWSAPWNVAEEDLGDDDVKTGERPDNLDVFEPITVWGYDQCDQSRPSQEEVRTRAAQNLRLREQFLVEDNFADRLLSDVDSAETVAGITTAVSVLESLFAATNTVGFIHAGAHMAAYAASAQLIVRSGSSLKTPMGHTWVFGGGYVDPLRSKLVATSPTFGWRTETVVRDSLERETGTFIAIAERSVVVGYEHLIGAVSVGAVPDNWPGDNYPGEDNYPGG
jgi:hypothetical protein